MMVEKHQLVRNHIQGQKNSETSKETKADKEMFLLLVRPRTDVGVGE